MGFSESKCIEHEISMMDACDVREDQAACNKAKTLMAHHLCYPFDVLTK